ncbi:universal stress protein [soil metagenome]
MMATVHVGVDDSAPSRGALVWAAQFAADFHVPLVIEHVVADSGSASESEEQLARLARAERLVEDCRDHVVAEWDGLEVTAHVLVGDPARAWGDECSPHDLLVIGTHKTGYLRGRALGSRGLEIIAATNCSVAVIPADHRVARSGVIIALTVPVPTMALRFGAAVAVGRHQPILLICPPGAADETSGTSVLARALQLVSRYAPRASVRTHLPQRQFADALLDASGAAQLLVLPERTGDGGGSVGPLTYEVLTNINGPVMIVRGAGGTFAPVQE